METLPATPPARGLGPWVIVALIAVVVLGMLAAFGIVVAGSVLVATAPSAQEQEDGTADEDEDEDDTWMQEEVDGEEAEVTDSSGRPAGPEVGTYDHPGTVEEHTFTWPTWTGGTLAVTALSTEVDPPLQDVAAEDLLQPGHQLVVVEYEVTYEGAGRLAPVEDLWVSAESDQRYFSDLAAGLLGQDLAEVPALESGESGTFLSAFIVPSPQLDSLRASVQTYNGEVLYYDVP